MDKFINIKIIKIIKIIYINILVVMSIDIRHVDLARLQYTIMTISGRPKK